MEVWGMEEIDNAVDSASVLSNDEVLRAKIDDLVEKWNVIAMDRGFPGNVKNFVNTLGRIIVAVCAGHRVFPSLALSQAALESGWGRTASSTLYGIKGKGAVFTTEEVIDGKRITIKDSFRQYPGAKEATEDYLAVLRLPRYKPVLDAATADEAAVKIRECGYATDPEYSNKIRSMMRWYEMRVFDVLRGA